MDEFSEHLWTVKICYDVEYPFQDADRDASCAQHAVTEAHRAQARVRNAEKARQSSRIRPVRLAASAFPQGRSKTAVPRSSKLSTEAAPSRLIRPAP